MSELDKLTKYLKDNHYRYVRIDEPPVKVNEYLTMDRRQVIVYDSNGKTQWDAICHRGSYGYEDGLLEIMGSITNEDVEGWLTANDIIARLEKADARK